MKVTNTYAQASVDEEGIDRFTELNSCLKPKWRFIMYRLSEDELTIFPSHCEPISDHNNEHKNLIDKLPDQDPCWIAYNFEYRVQNGGKRNKVAIINWVPDTLVRETLKESARIKMMAVTRNGTIKGALRGAVCFIQGNCPEDLTFTKLLSKIAKFEREPIDYEWIDQQFM